MNDRNSVPLKGPVEDYKLMSDIAKRAKELFDSQGPPRDLISWFMDIEAVYLYHGLDLEGLLAAGDGDFGHDIAGIYNHLNRETKQLEDCFSPRFTARNKEDE